MRVLAMAVAVFAAGCGSSNYPPLTSGSAPSAAVAIAKPLKPADKMSDAELIEAYRQYEKEHADMKSGLAFKNFPIIHGTLANKAESDLPAILEQMRKSHELYDVGNKRLKETEAAYARAWNPLGLKVLAPIDIGEPATMKDIRERWAYAKRAMAPPTNVGQSLPVDPILP